MATFNAIDYTEAAGRLASGAFVRVPVSGSGMRPFLRPGEDSVLLAPVKLSGHNYSQWELNAFQSRCGNPDRRYRNRSCASGRITIRRRDVVLVRHKDGMTPVLMRVVHVWGTLLLLREDSSYSPSESATVSDVLGVVIEGTCRGGKHFNSSSKKWRYASKAWTASYRPRLWAGRIRKSPTRSAISMLAVLMDRTFGMRMTKMWMIVFSLAFAMALSALDMFFVFSNMYVAGYPVFNEDFYDTERYTNGILMTTPVMSTIVTAVMAVYTVLAYRGLSKDIFIDTTEDGA